jgi:hypothetical protein
MISASMSEVEHQVMEMEPYLLGEVTDVVVFDVDVLGRRGAWSYMSLVARQIKLSLSS